MGGKANLRNALESGRIPIDERARFKGRGTNIRLDIDPEAPRPSYEYAAGEE
jgi:hypothetical protein